MERTLKLTILLAAVTSKKEKKKDRANMDDDNGKEQKSRGQVRSTFKLMLRQ